MTSHKIAIRQFRPEDYNNVIGLWIGVGLPVRPLGRDSLKRIKEQVTRENVTLLVAETDKEIIGTVLVTHDCRKGWINRLAVDNSFRRHNLATKLDAKAEKWLQAKGLEVYACVIENDNTVSMEFFKKLGYQEWDVKYFSKRLTSQS